MENLENLENLYKIKYLKYKKKYLDLKVMQEGGNCIKWTDVTKLVEKNKTDKSKVIKSKSKDKPTIITISSLTANIIHSFLKLNEKTIDTFIVINPSTKDITFNGDNFIEKLIVFINKIILNSKNINTSFKKICLPENDCNEKGCHQNAASKAGQMTFYYRCLNYVLADYTLRDKSKIADTKILTDLTQITDKAIKKTTVADIENDAKKIAGEIKQIGNNTYKGATGDKARDSIDAKLLSVQNAIGSIVPFGSVSMGWVHTSVEHAKIWKFLQTINQQVITDLEKIKNISIYNIKIVNNKGIDCKISTIGKNVIDILMLVFNLSLL